MCHSLLDYFSNGTQPVIRTYSIPDVQQHNTQTILFIYIVFGCVLCEYLNVCRMYNRHRCTTFSVTIFACFRFLSRRLSREDIEAKVGEYRNKLMGQGKAELPKDEFGRVL